MKLASGTTTVTVVLLAAVLLIGLSCSRDAAVTPDTTTPEATTAVLAEAVTFIETFDNNSNVGDWSYGTTTGFVIEQTGGNPDWYLHDDNVQSFFPHPSTGLGVSSAFTGNYKARNVVSLGIDLRSFDYDLDISGRYLTLMLMNDNGTPYDVSDDWGAYIIGPVKVPSKYVPMKLKTALNAPGWVSYDFIIESQSNRLPDGWVMWRNSASGQKPSTGNWKTLMDDVSYVMYYYGDPELYYIIDTYDLGLDNPRITTE